MKISKKNYFRYSPSNKEVCQINKPKKYQWVVSTSKKNKLIIMKDSKIISTTIPDDCYLIKQTTDKSFQFNPEQVTTKTVNT